MAGPAVVIVAGFITAWLAIESNDGLVDDNYYKVGLSVNQQLKQKQLAAELNLKADLGTCWWSVCSTGALWFAQRGFAGDAAAAARPSDAQRRRSDHHVEARGAGVYVVR